MLEAFLYPLLWTLGFGLGLVAVAFVAFLVYGWLRSIADEGDAGGDGE